jgi:TnpA family transposase
MSKTLKIRKGPSYSAIKYSEGTKKKGNDGNMWKIVKTKKGTKRWLKISSVTSKNKSGNKSIKSSTENLQDVDNVFNIRNKNKKLYKFWLDLANTKHSVFIYNDKSYKIIRKNIKEEQEKAEKNTNIIAILDSGPSFDAYRELYRKANNKSVEEVIKNYEKYFNEGSSEKRIFC